MTLIRMTTAEQLEKKAREVYNKSGEHELNLILQKCREAAENGKFSVEFSWISEHVRDMLRKAPHAFQVNQIRTGINEECWEVRYAR